MITSSRNPTSLSSKELSLLAHFLPQIFPCYLSKKPGSFKDFCTITSLLEGAGICFNYPGYNVTIVIKDEDWSIYSIPYADGSIPGLLAQKGLLSTLVVLNTTSYYSYLFKERYIKLS